MRLECAILWSRAEHSVDTFRGERASFWEQEVLVRRNRLSLRACRKRLCLLAFAGLPCLAALALLVSRRITGLGRRMRARAIRIYAVTSRKRRAHSG